MLTRHSIVFNVDPGSTAHSALNIRKNRDELVPFPEYNSAIGTARHQRFPDRAEGLITDMPHRAEGD